jgi:hypothetical protein
MKRRDSECPASVGAVGLALPAPTPPILHCPERGWITLQAARNWKWGLLSGKGIVGYLLPERVWRTRLCPDFSIAPGTRKRPGFNPGNTFGVDVCGAMPAVMIKAGPGEELGVGRCNDHSTLRSEPAQQGQLRQSR